MTIIGRLDSRISVSYNLKRAKILPIIAKNYNPKGA